MRWLVQAELGQSFDVRKSQQLLLGNTLPAATRAQALQATGLAAIATMRLPEALKAFAEARRILSDSGRFAEEADAISRLTVALIDKVGAEPAVPWIAQLQRAADSSGSLLATVGCRYARSILSMRAGRRSSFLREISAGELCLAASPHAYWKAKFCLLRSAFFGYDGNSSSANQSAATALQSAIDSGHAALAAAATANLAFLALLSGDHEVATLLVSRALAEPTISTNVRVALLDSASQIAASRGNVSGAVSASLKIQEMDSVLATEQSAWHLLTRVRHAALIPDGISSSAFALSSLPRIRRSGDGNLLPRMQLLAAEALALEGKPREASAMLLEASDSAVRPGLDVVGELWRVAGRIAPRTPLARAHFDRAHRVLTDIGYLTPAAEVSRQADSAGLPDDSVPLTPRDAGARMLHGLSAVVDAIGRPEVAGRELLHLLFTTDAVRSGAVIRRRGQTEVVLHRADSVTEDASSTAPVTIPLGADEESEYRLDVDMVQTTSAATTVMAARRLAGSARDLQRLREQERESSPLWPDSTPDVQLGVVVGSEAMRSVLALVRRVATSPVTVLITGETGTGKEVLARALHEASPRKDRPFVPFNCSAVAKDMLDAQLFGYRRGAFTGAQEAFPGVIRAASGGTLFLDEIGEVSLEVQPKLLRFLESGDVHPLGEPRPVAADVRVVAATNADLEALVADGRFREDLYYRLHVVRVVVPPLRERREEIPLLVRYWLTRFGDEFHKPDVRLADDTLEFLTLYAWPGNVRELTNEVRRLVALAESGAVLMPEHLSPRIAASRRTRPSSEGELTPDELVVRTDQPMAATIAHVERTMIQQALARCSGRVEDAARLLGLSRKGLYLKRQRYGID